jgi:Mn2+/Fe2+ NRAMP family transporter
MAPLLWVRIWPSSCFMHAHTPRRLIALTRSKTSADSSAASLGGTWMPELLYAMSSRPNVSTVAFTMEATLSSSETSHCTPRTRWPAAVSSSAAVPSVVSLMSAMTTAAPASANAPCGGKAHARAATGHECYLPSEVVGRVHGGDPASV